jgi:hypothetical protein
MYQHPEMSIAADDLPVPRRGHFQKKASPPLPRWYSKKFFDF